MRQSERRGKRKIQAKREEELIKSAKRNWKRIPSVTQDKTTVGTNERLKNQRKKKSLLLGETEMPIKSQ